MLFHATLNEYSAGQLLVANKLVDQYRAAVEILEESKPEQLPSRISCKFSSDDPVFSCLFAIGQKYDRNEIKLYKVDMAPFHRAPMALVHAIHRKLEANADVSKLVNEYWAPKMEWEFFECFGPSMKIMERVDLPKFNEQEARDRYSLDFSRAKGM